MASPQQRCPHCDNPASGNFCNICGGSLHESFWDEVRSKVTTPLVALLAFVKAVWLMWFAPVRFMRSSATGQPPVNVLSFPLAFLWRLLEPRRPQKVARPFVCLAMVIAVVTMLGYLERAAWKATGFDKQVLGQGLDETKEKLEAQFKEQYRAAYGRELYFIDSAHLTGFDAIDKPVEEIIGLFNYAFYGLVAMGVLVVLHNKVPSKLYLQGYVYAISAAIAASAILTAVGLVGFTLGAMAGMTAGVVMFVLAGLGQALGYLLIIYFVVVLPNIVLPRALDVPIWKVLVATSIAVFSWLIVRFIFFSLLQWQMGIIWR